MSWLTRLASKSSAEPPSAGEPITIIRARRPAAKGEVRDSPPAAAVIAH
jgi:hypothetical protein